MKPLAAAFAAAILAGGLACLADAPAVAHPRKPPHWVHCKPPFRPRWISLPTGKPGWKCVALIKPLR
jgi:hypothetical protein